MVGAQSRVRQYSRPSAEPRASVSEFQEGNHFLERRHRADQPEAQSTQLQSRPIARSAVVKTAVLI